MRSKPQLLKTASILKDFTAKVKNAQMGETLTPETVKEIAEEIAEVASVAAELAMEIGEGVPAEEENRSPLGNNREEEGPEQLEVAQDETDDEKKKRMAKKEAAEDDDKDKENKDKIKNLEASLEKLTREATLAKLAPGYASLFPQSMHEAKLNEIINSKQPLQIVEAKIQEASDIIKNKTMVKVASMLNSPYDLNNSSDGDEIDISSRI